MNVSEERARRSAELKREIIAQEAADWYLRNQEGLDARQREAFGRWLKESPVHVEEYLGMTQLANELPDASADPEVPLDELIAQALAAPDDPVEPIAAYVPPPHERVTRGAPWLFGGAAAAAAGVIAVAFVWWGGLLRVASTGPAEETWLFATEHGGQLTQRLADNSVLHLNTDTSVRVVFAPGRRWVDVERGQVEFDVMHDATRPFHVTAGTAEVVDVGTKFDVYLQSGSTLVTVVEGRVTVGRSTLLRGLGGEAGAGAQKAPIYVDAGQQVRVVEGEPSIPAPVDTHRATAWLRHQIAFEHESLATVAAEFNRYGATPIEIETPELQGLAVSGVFAADDTESFVAFLRTLDGVRVEATPQRIRVYRSLPKT